MMTVPDDRSPDPYLVSIAPPSDVVLDVAQAADPQKVRAATARLVRLGSGTAAVGDDFASELASAGSSPGASASSATSLDYSSAARIEMPHKTSPYEKFESMMLRNFLEELLPKDSDLFGDAASADAYRSMMADQIATQIAKTGRLGVARAIERAEAAHGTGAPSRPPSLSPVGLDQSTGLALPRSPA